MALDERRIFVQQADITPPQKKITKFYTPQIETPGAD